MEIDRNDDGNLDVVQLSIKFASLKEQSMFYGDIYDNDPIDNNDVMSGQGSPEELEAAI
jgi:hypothetical protein